MKFKSLISAVVCAAMLFCLCGCVDQHPDEASSVQISEETRLIATSPAVAQICSRLDLDLVGVCQTNSTSRKIFRISQRSAWP